MVENEVKEAPSAVITGSSEGESRPTTKAPEGVDDRAAAVEPPAAIAAADEPVDDPQPTTKAAPDQVEPGTFRPGFMASFALATGALWVLRWLLPKIPGDFRQYVLVGLLSLALFTKPIRRIAVAAMVVMLGVGGFGTYIKHKRGDHPIHSAKEALVATWKNAIKVGPGKQLTSLITEKDYGQYLDPLRLRDRELREKATGLVSACPGSDHLCETIKLLSFVATSVTYRSDSRAGADYIQSPEETLKISAGDCEDQTILLVSLLENVGIRTYMAFTKSHVYPMACFDNSFERMLVEGVKRAGDPSSYLQLIAPSNRSRVSERDLSRVVGYRVGELYCYPLEPTAEQSWVGFDDRKQKVRALIDPSSREEVAFRR